MRQSSSFMDRVRTASRKRMAVSAKQQDWGLPLHRTVWYTEYKMSASPVKSLPQKEESEKKRLDHYDG